MAKENRTETITKEALTKISSNGKILNKSRAIWNTKKKSPRKV